MRPRRSWRRAWPRAVFGARIGREGLVVIIQGQRVVLMDPGHVPQVGQGQGHQRPRGQLPGLLQGLQIGGIGLP